MLMAKVMEQHQAVVTVMVVIELLLWSLYCLEGDETQLPLWHMCSHVARL